MLIMNKALPAPEWETKFLFTGKIFVVILFQLFFNLFDREVFDFFKLGESLNILLICHGVLNLLNLLIFKKHG